MMPSSPSSNLRPTTRTKLGGETGTMDFQVRRSSSIGVPRRTWKSIVLACRLLVILVGFVLSCDLAYGQAAVAEPIEAERPRPVEAPRKTYLGRVLAQPMSHAGASWLIRPERDDEENASESFVQLNLAPGMTVCDLGCGNGYWTIPMARKVGADGRVWRSIFSPRCCRSFVNARPAFSLKHHRADSWRRRRPQSSGRRDRPAA